MRQKRKMLIRVLILAFLGFMGNTSNVFAHKYFFSITEMEWQPESKQFEVIVDLSTHDLEFALSALFNKSIHVEHPEFETLTKQWLKQHMFLKQSGVLIPLIWVGQQSTHKQVSLFLKTAEIDQSQPLTLTNSLLTNLFSKQVNTVNITALDQTQTLTFDLTTNVHNIDLFN
jgi:hypothetical protein